MEGTEKSTGAGRDAATEAWLTAFRVRLVLSGALRASNWNSPGPRWAFCHWCGSPTKRRWGCHETCFLGKAQNMQPPGPWPDRFEAPDAETERFLESLTRP